MNARQAYFDNLRHVLQEVAGTQAEAMEKAAEKLAEATLEGQCIFAFGCNHASLATLDLYYRTGGMATINPVRAPGLNLDVDPATMTSEMERLNGYGSVIVDSHPIGAGDVVIIHSVSGRNTVTVDVALRAKEIGAYTIALTNMRTSPHVTSRHPSGKNLYEVADLVLDNCGSLGDASLVIQGVPEKVAPTSTAVGAAILNAIVARAVQLVTQRGGVAPVFVSANLDEGDAHNKAMLAQYKDRIFYMNQK